MKQFSASTWNSISLFSLILLILGLLVESSDYRFILGATILASSIFGIKYFLVTGNLGLVWAFSVMALTINPISGLVLDIYAWGTLLLIAIVVFPVSIFKASRKRRDDNKDKSEDSYNTEVLNLYRFLNRALETKSLNHELIYKIHNSLDKLEVEHNTRTANNLADYRYHEVRAILYYYQSKDSNAADEINHAERLFGGPYSRSKNLRSRIEKGNEKTVSTREWFNKTRRGLGSYAKLFIVGIVIIVIARYEPAGTIATVIMSGVGTIGFIFLLLGAAGLLGEAGKKAYEHYKD